VPHTPSPTQSPTDPVTRGLLTLCPGAYVCVHTPVDKLTERAVLHASRPAFFLSSRSYAHCWCLLAQMRWCRLYAAVRYGYIYTSQDAGVTWTKGNQPKLSSSESSTVQAGLSPHRIPRLGSVISIGN
jgi:hypothetical protein